MTDTKPSTSSDTQAQKPDDITTEEIGDDASVTNETSTQVDANNQAKQQQEEKSADELSNAKDKAQITATTAMSIVNVALLKSVIEVGPENDRFYYPSITLICLALVLQITAGIIAMWVSQMKGYYQKHQDDFCEDICENLCCCKIISKKRWRRKEKRKRKLKQLQNADDMDDFDAIHKHPKSTAPASLKMEREKQSSSMLPSIKSNGVVDDEDEELEGGCCPFTLTTHVTPEYEYEILQGFNDQASENLYHELRAKEAEEHLTMVTASLDQAKVDLDILEKDKESTPEENFIEQATTIRKNIEKLKVQAEASKKYIQAYQIKKAQYDLLFYFADAIRKNRVIKMAAFWQNMINYILYSVFIMNMFIAGFGVADSSGDKVAPITTVAP